MPKFKDLTGMKFGMLTVIRRENNDNSRHVMYLCQCECSNMVIVRGDHLTSSKTRSCGCLFKKSLLNNKKNYRHGKYGSRIYHIWCAMKRRCNNPNAINYDRYGEKGITVCTEWTEFSNFYEWAINHGYAENLTIDRIDTNEQYNPSNCRWVTYKKQNNNKRNNFFITFNEKTHTLHEWSEILNINYNTLWRRIKRDNWSIERAFTTPIHNKNKKEK